MKTITYQDVFNESERLWDTEYDPEVKSENSYCHKQSFKWGFQEGVDYACKMLSNKKREVTYSSEDNQKKAEWFSNFKEGDILAVNVVDIDRELVITIFRGLDGERVLDYASLFTGYDGKYLQIKQTKSGPYLTVNEGVKPSELVNLFVDTGMLCTLDNVQNVRRATADEISFLLSELEFKKSKHWDSDRLEMVNIKY